MEALIKSISEKAGITPEQSKSAIDTVLASLKDKMPESLGAQLSSLLEGKDLDIAAVAKEIGENKLNELKEEASEKFNEVKDAIKKLF